AVIELGSSNRNAYFGVRQMLDKSRVEFQGLSKSKGSLGQRSVALRRAPRLPAGIAALLSSTVFTGFLIVATLPAAIGQATPRFAEGKAAAIKEGASLFRSNCSPCHGLGGRGGGR